MQEYCAILAFWFVLLVNCEWLASSNVCLWNYGAYKNTYNAIEDVNDNEIKEILTKASNMFYNNLNVVLNILSSGVNNE